MRSMQYNIGIPYIIYSIDLKDSGSQVKPPHPSPAATAAQLSLRKSFGVLAPGLLTTLPNLLAVFSFALLLPMVYII